ncbi:hypothetical protein DdX_06693 [Ditylenchus destructor]|uniref:Uncharacterized protein n=1 Tax=Ditylenchus destructor TaxID=166010 RepID=A0AAD4NBB2_9BILA|nr:hypothetical protein DdX_06693 [Ditylenchus destructor]
MWWQEKMHPEGNWQECCCEIGRTATIKGRVNERPFFFPAVKAVSPEYPSAAYKRPHSNGKPFVFTEVKPICPEHPAAAYLIFVAN